MSLIVVNYNGRQHLPGLLAALADQTYRDFELVFVDNGSEDGSVALVERTCHDAGIALVLQCNDANVGFAAACNQGIAQAGGAWIATLNNDTQPEPNWLEQMLAATKDAPDVGMIASKMLFANSAGQINSAGIALDWAGLAWDWRGGEPDRPDEVGLSEVFGPCAGAAFYARRMLAEIGLFDGDFFAYLEDVDLAWRARLAGWRCLFQPRARVRHVHSGTFGHSALKRYLLGRNKMWLLVKNYPGVWLPVRFPLVLAYDLMATIYGVATTRRLEPLFGRLAAWRRLPMLLRKRHEIQSRWHDVANCARVMQPVAGPSGIARRYAHLP